MTNADLEREERRRQQAEIAESLKESGALDEIFARIDAGEPLTGHAGLLKGMLEASLERGLDTELPDHVGYDRGARRRRSSRTRVTARSPRRWPPRSATSSWRSRVTATARSRRCWSPEASVASMGSTR